MLAVKPGNGPKSSADVTIDYSAFAQSFGGGWASRLTVRTLPACGLATPFSKGCGVGTVLKTRNDPSTGTLSATLPLPAVAQSALTTGDPVTLSGGASRTATGLSAAPGTLLLAVDAAPSGPSGSFSATPLSPSASWTAGGSNGSFNWSYDIDAPDVAGGLSPDLNLSYSSQSIDGRTAATNNQSNWVGDGWSLEPGYVERRYVPCADDKAGSNNTTAKVGDLCWKKDNAVLNLGGKTSTLIWDTDSKTWHLESDDGTKIAKTTSTTNNNGDDNGEYWRVTTPDGTRYYFGLNRAKGWADGDAETGSAWTVPVYGNHSGEPCYDAAFKDAWCQQAWRWNLDLVVDPHGDAMTYYWAKEGNYYGRNVNPDTGASTATPYTRGGYLKRIEYGLRSTDYYAKPAAKVDFTVSERCFTGCTTFDKDNAKNWQDVPFDQYCASGTECKDRYSPSFWTRKRLTEIETSVLVGTTYSPVDSWTLAQKFLDPGTDEPLWLTSVTRTGLTPTSAPGTPPASPTTPLPAVTFKAVKLSNRVEGATTGGKPDPLPAYARYRVSAIDTESGGTIGVTYSAEDCKAGDVPTPSSNTRRCYPVMWSPPDAPAAEYEPYLDWFHAYVVTQVLEHDGTANGTIKQTNYSYKDGMAWTKAKDDEFVQAKHLTYGDRKGYGRLQTRTGAGLEQRTLQETRFFRGITGTKVKDYENVEFTDQEPFGGMIRAEATYDGDGGDLLSTTSLKPWMSRVATATETRTEGLPPLHAYATGDAQERTRTAVGTGWRTTEKNWLHDEYGRVFSESDLGDVDKGGDEECTTTTYTPEGTYTLGLASEVKVVSVACGTPALPVDLVSVKRNYYDDATSLTTAPVEGDVTRREEQDAAGTGFQTVSTHTYDIHGRELTTKNALGDTVSTIAYAPATVAPPLTKTETNALDQTTTTTYNPKRGVPVSVVDANGKRTDAVHDGLGRVRKVWQPGWPMADHVTQPSAEFEYKISKTDVNAVITKTLKRDGTYKTTYSLYDGLLRERQTQAWANGTQHSIISETHYDSHGWARQTFDPYYAEVAPSTTLVTAKAMNELPSVTENTFDGTGRITKAVMLKFSVPQSQTTTTYDGDRTTVIPPQGGTATTTVTDVQGRTTQLIRYAGAGLTNPSTTTYRYGNDERPTSMTDPAGNTWTYTFDFRGRQTKVDDPDKGVATTTYDALDRPVSTTDARKITLTTGYDKLGRTTEVKQGSTVLTKSTYDTLAKGQLTSSTRYAGGAAYTTAADGYNDRYQPTSTTVTVPATAGALAGTYTWKYGYNEETGLLDWTLNPAVGNVPSEHVTTNYNEDDQPMRLSNGGASLVSNTIYDVFSRPVRTEFGPLGKKVYSTQVYDEHTGRMIRQVTDRDLAPQRVDDLTYSYDQTGNLTGLKTVSGQDAQKSTDNQCFTHDALGQMKEAWTAKTDCATAPSATSVGGPDAYWLSFGFDKIGNRTEQTDHGTGTSLGTDVRTTYTMPAPTPGVNRPHAVQKTTITGGPDNGRIGTYVYDDAGNTTTRPTGSSNQVLTWDAEGHLATLTEAGKTTSYIYDAAGNRLLAKNGDGTSVLTLPNGNELTLSANGTKSGTRYYTHNGQTVAVNNGGTVSYLLSDHHGTALTAIAVGTLAITRRKQTPFGGPRGSQSGTGSFGSRGFIGGTADPTDLTHLGAREYDPTLGRFLSVDPLMITMDPRQHNAYVYGNNNPVTFSDPTGEALPECASGQYVCKNKGTEVVRRGKNYEKITKGEGGTLSPGYVEEQRQLAKDCQRDPDCRNAASGPKGTGNTQADAKRRKVTQTLGAIQRGLSSARGAVGLAKAAGGWLDDRGHDIADGAKAAGRWVDENRGLVVSVVATVSCFVPAVGWASCAALQAVALGVRMEQRAEEGGGWHKTWKANTADAVISAGSLGGSSALRYAKFGQLSRWTEPMRAPSFWQKSAWQGGEAYHPLYQLAVGAPAIANVFRKDP
ncbi:RHS repeat-associated core domain-containing protein [Streptomyces sp. 12297]